MFEDDVSTLPALLLEPFVTDCTLEFPYSLAVFEPRAQAMALQYGLTEALAVRVSKIDFFQLIVQPFVGVA